MVQRLETLIEGVQERLSRAQPAAIGEYPRLLPQPEVWEQVWCMLPLTTQAAFRASCQSAITWVQPPSQLDEKLLQSLQNARTEALATHARAWDSQYAGAPCGSEGGCLRSPDDVTQIVSRHLQRNRTVDDVLGTMLRRRDGAQHRAAVEAKQIASSLDAQRFAERMAQQRMRAEPDSEVPPKPAAASTPPPLWTPGPHAVYSNHWDGRSICSTNPRIEPTRTRQLEETGATIVLPSVSESESRRQTTQCAIEVIMRCSDTVLERRITSDTLGLEAPRASQVRAAEGAGALQKLAVVSKPTPTCNLHVEMNRLAETSLHDAIPAAAATMRRSTTATYGPLCMYVATCPAWALRQLTTEAAAEDHDKEESAAPSTEEVSSEPDSNSESDSDFVDEGEIDESGIQSEALELGQQSLLPDSRSALEEEVWQHAANIHAKWLQRGWRFGATEPLQQISEVLQYYDVSGVCAAVPTQKLQLVDKCRNGLAQGPRPSPP